MPINEKGQVVLTFWKGMTCWGCIFLWWIFWGLVAGLTKEYLNAPDWVVFILMGVCGGMFGIVPVIFFIHEERKYRNGSDDFGSTEQPAPLPRTE